MSYYQDNHITIYNKDCRDMSELADESIQCVVTSPPYWGLRKYSGEQELIWGDNHCEHLWISTPTQEAYSGRKRFIHSHNGDQAKRINRQDNPECWEQLKQGDFCSLCGAWKGAYGLEPTPEMYIEHTIEILREIRRVLRKDGVVFWNIGDSYFGGGFGTSPGGNEDFAQRYPKQASNKGTAEHEDRKLLGSLKKGHSILKPKDLCLIPFRVAIAAQEDGWWVRSVIIWSKPNPMPESVTDRPTESHEYILLLTKSGTSQYWTHRDHEGTRTQPKPDYRWVRDGVEVSVMPEGWTPKNKIGWDRINLWKGHDYYWDADAVRKPYAESTLPRMMRGVGNHKYVGIPEAAGGGAGNQPRDNIRKEFEAWQYKGQATKDYEAAGAQDPSDTKRRIIESIKKQEAGANLKSVWEFPTQPYPEAHFAVFPEKLPEICIKASTPEVGCCSKCGAPWERISEVQYHNQSKTETEKYAKPSFGTKVTFGRGNSEHQTLGWQPTCKCNADKVPSLVLDPFCGAGTTLWVAKKLNRKAVGYEISEEYCRLCVERNRQQGLC